MAKQKNRLTTTRPQNRLARERFAYPAPTLHIQQTVGDETRTLLTLGPTLDHISRPNRNLATTKLAYPTTARISFRQCQIRQPGESTSRSIKSKLPTLDLPWTTLTLVCTGADIKLDQDNQPTLDRLHTTSSTRPAPSRSILETDHVQAAYPTPSITQSAHDRAARTSTDS
ncbi:hypothetical protein ACKAV7_003732 [Fusarium commune]